MVTKTALVSGSRGFVARHIIPALRRKGYVVFGFDIKNGLHEDARDWFRYNDQHYDLVIHLAAVVGGRQKIEGAPLDLAVDLAIDAEMFAWAMRTRPGKVVYFSSSAAYPIWMQTKDSQGRKLVESDIDLGHVETPDLTYGWAKLTGEMLAEHAQEQGQDVLVVRPFSGYGPDQDLEYPFPSFIQRAKERADPFDIWGDGEQARDFVHIDDVTGAVMAAVENQVQGPINICTGVRTSFNDLAAMVCEQVDYCPDWRHLSAPVGVYNRVGNPIAMEKFYQPKITIEKGIEQALCAH